MRRFQASVIIPTYNRKLYLSQAIASVQKQTLPDIEIIIVDDGSTDGTKEMLDASLQPGSVRYLYQANAGQSAARNLGLAEASAEFICFLDDDDILPKDKMKWQVLTLRANQSIEALGGQVSFDLSPIDLTEAHGQDQWIDYQEVFSCPFKTTGQVLARTHAIRDIGGFDERLRGAEDWDVYIKLSRRAPLLRVDRLSLQYREHSSSHTKNH